MRALVWILGILLTLVPAKNVDVVVIPPMPQVSPSEVEAIEWDAFWLESYEENALSFEALFDAMEYKRAKNGASMVRRPGDKSFKFVKKG